MKRPLMPVALLFMAGILMPWLVSVSPFIILSSGVLLAMLTLLWGGGRPILVWPLVFLTGWTDIALRTAIISPHDLRRILSDQPELVSLHGALNETPTLRVFQQNEKEVWHTQARINVSALRFDRGAWQPAVGRVAVTTPELLTNFFGGQTVEISGVVRRPNIAVAEGTFDYRAYLSQQGIYYQLETESEQDWEIISSPGTAPLADRFRAWARKALALGLPEEDEALR